MANYRIAKALDRMRAQFNEASPRRNKSSDGWIGDAAHASRSSDHNPWVKDGKIGVVTALDITHDPANGVHTWNIAEFLRQVRDPRIKYVISNRRIWSSVSNPYTWRTYTGSNPHSSHMHVSVHSSKGHYDNAGDWRLFPNGNPPLQPDPDSPSVRPILRKGSTGELVKEVQSVLSVSYPETKPDGIFGSVTEATVKKFQTKNKLKSDGIVGPLTWAAFDKIEQRDNGEHDGDALED